MVEPDVPAAQLDPHELVELLEAFILGEAPTLTGPQVADEAGIDFETARERWRALGFTAVPEDEIAFAPTDVHALELVERLRALGIAEQIDEASLIRTMGRSFALLAEWQMSLLANAVDLEHTSVAELGEVMAEVTPIVEEVMNYVWRRHTLNAASRMLFAGTSDAETTALAVGFADIVGYTSRTRQLRREELARLVDEFEGIAQTIITEHGGRIIKTIGDEVLFVADAPDEAATIALELAERHVLDEDFPQLRVGVAYGPVLRRLGDVYGSVVNIAARLTSTARPGRVLVDRDLAEALEKDERFRLRRTRPRSVKGYRRLEPWALRRPVGEDPEFDPERLPGPASQFLAQHGRGLVRSVEDAREHDED